MHKALRRTIFPNSASVRHPIELRKLRQKCARPLFTGILQRFGGEPPPVPVPVIEIDADSDNDGAFIHDTPLAKLNPYPDS